MAAVVVVRAIITQPQMAIPVKCFCTFDTPTNKMKKKEKPSSMRLVPVDCLCNSIIFIDHLSGDTYLIFYLKRKVKMAMRDTQITPIS
jgi:hypothetical protein